MAMTRGDRLLLWAAFLTWSVVAWPLALHVLHRPRALSEPDVAGAVACLVVFLALFLSAYRITRKSLHVAATALQGVVALAMIALTGHSFAPIMLVIVAAQAAFHLTLGQAFTWGVAQSAAMYAIAQLRSESSALFVTLAYFGFQSFAIITSYIARSESDARTELQRVNAELESATALLSLNSRIAERTRISRDLHDVLGHHLAALSINLEIASHLAEGRAKEQIEASQAIAKRLLADVRATVSRLRSDDSVDLHEAIAGLAAVFPRPAIHIEISDAITVADPLTAEVILRCCQEAITNAARHSGASNLWLRVHRGEGSIEIAARDDGAGASTEPNIGLRSIRDRVEACGGSVSAQNPLAGGFLLTIAIPDAPDGTA